jgi:uracil-DNA glycosylase
MVRQSCVVSRAPLSELVAADWAAALLPAEPTIASIGDFLRSETSAGRRFLPAGRHILRAFTQPLAGVRVLIMGQDPYPTPGHPVGLSFSVDRDVRPLPRSLANIYRELTDDVHVGPPEHGDLSAWSERGVLLLNRVLTVRTGAPGSHRGKGWESVTDLAIEALVRRGGPLVAILWGRDAQSLRPALAGIPIIASVHPSPLSASRGFFGSRPFSRANESLLAQGGESIDWSLPTS